MNINLLISKLHENLSDFPFLIQNEIAVVHTRHPENVAELKEE